MKKLLIALAIFGMNFAYAAKWIEVDNTQDGTAILFAQEGVQETDESYDVMVKVLFPDNYAIVSRQTIMKKSCKLKKGVLFSFKDSKMTTYNFKFGEPSLAAMIAKDICDVAEYKKENM